MRGGTMDDVQCDVTGLRQGRKGQKHCSGGGMGSLVTLKGSDKRGSNSGYL